MTFILFSPIQTVQSEAVNPEALTPFMRVGVLCAGDEEFMANSGNMGDVENAINKANTFRSICYFDSFEWTFGLHFEVVGWVTWDSQDDLCIASLMAAEVWTETGFKTGMVVNGQFVHMLCACTGQDIEGYLACTFPNGNITLIETGYAGNFGAIRHEFSHQFHGPECHNVCVMADFLGGVFPERDWCPNCEAFIQSNKFKFTSPVCAMKTGTDGYFYVPNVATDLLKIEMLFNNLDIVRDQIGGTSPYSTITAYPDRIVDIEDVYQVALNFGKSGTYITSFAGVTVTFNVGGTRTPFGYDFVEIPQGATNFTVKRNGNPISAMIIFVSTEA